MVSVNHCGKVNLDHHADDTKTTSRTNRYGRLGYLLGNLYLTGARVTRAVSNHCVTSSAMSFSESRAVTRHRCDYWAPATLPARLKRVQVQRSRSSHRLVLSVTARLRIALEKNVANPRSPAVMRGFCPFPVSHPRRLSARATRRAGLRSQMCARAVPGCGHTTRSA